MTHLRFGLPHTSTCATYSRNTDSTKQPEGSFISPQPRTSHHVASSSTAHLAGPPEVSPSRPEIFVSSPEKESTQDLDESRMMSIFPYNGIV